MFQDTSGNINWESLLSLAATAVSLALSGTTPRLRWCAAHLCYSLCLILLKQSVQSRVTAVWVKTHHNSHPVLKEVCLLCRRNLNLCRRKFSHPVINLICVDVWEQGDATNSGSAPRTANTYVSTTPWFSVAHLQVNKHQHWESVITALRLVVQSCLL